MEEHLEETFVSMTVCTLCGFCTFPMTEMNKGSAMWPRVILLSKRPIMPVTNVRESGVTVNLHGFIDSLSFCFCSQKLWVLCPLQAINISQSQQHPSIFYTVSHLFPLCDRPLHLSGFVLSLLFRPGLISLIGTALACSFTHSPLERLFVVKIVI